MIIIVHIKNKSILFIVDMSDSKLPFNASASAQGIIHQFYIGLNKCFSLVSGERVYIERYGDISVSNGCQIEVKNYSDELTDVHENIWKTLKNWLHPNFDPSLYKSLILLTTQYFGTSSSFFKWNILESSQKLTILNDIYDQYSKRNKKSETTEKILDYVMSDKNKVKLKTIIDKFVITTGCSNGDELFNQIKDEHGKGVFPENRDDFINSLLGYIISPPVADKSGWEISFENFSAELAKYTDLYRTKTFIFPTRKNVNFDINQYNEHMFVQKIKEIEYEDEVPHAISDYVQTNDIIINDLKKHTIPPTVYETYNDNLADIHNQEYRAAKRHCSKDNIIDASQDFYDEIFRKPVPPFANFSMTPLFFRNGIIHGLIDDNNRNLKWKLRDE